MISIVIPAYNEENAIAVTIKAARDALDVAGVTDGEVILVDDGSHDRTSAVAAEHGATVVRHPHNLGYGAALKAGITSARHDTIIITDADLTYPIERIDDLLEKYRQGFDMVVGARTGRNYSPSAGKAVLRSILTFLVEFTSGRKVPDVNSGFRIFSRKSVMPYFVHLCDTFSFTTSLTLAYMMTRKFVSYVEIPYGERDGQSKVRLLRDSIRTLQYIVLAATYYDPMKLFSLFSIICILLSFAGFLISALFHINGGYLLGLGGMLLALLIFSLGLLASLLKQIMDK